MASAVDWVPKKGDLAGYAWTHLLDLIHSCERCVVRGKGVCVEFAGDESKRAAAYVGTWCGGGSVVLCCKNCLLQADGQADNAGRRYLRPDPVRSPDPLCCRPSNRP